MNRSFRDRLDAATYADDDETVGVFELSRGEPDAIWLSGKLFRRLSLVATAYELHLLPHLGGTDPVSLNQQQCAALLDELGFVTGILDDPLIEAVVQELESYLVVRARQGSNHRGVTFEGD